MSESLTNGSDAAAASTEPTAESAAETPVAETQNQEATPQTTQEGGEQAKASEATAAQTPTEETKETNTEGEQKQTEEKAASEAQTDDGLAKFAKSQGFDPEGLTDGERRALKIAQDNQKAFRSKSVADSKAGVEGDEVTRDEIESFKQEFRSYQAEKQAENFFKEEGRDDALAPVMSDIIEEKKKEHGADYARVLSKDLNLLYDLARIRQTGSTASVDAEAIRREERESINKKLSSSTPSQHASQGGPSTSQKVDKAWIQNEYNPRDPEHVKLVDAYFAGA